MRWAADYVGIPYLGRGRTKEGADCWGIAYMIHKEILGNDNFPLLGDSYDDVDNLDQVNMAYLDNRSKFEFVPYTSRVEGDIMMFRVKGLPVHVGVVVTDDKMIHSLPGHASVFESYTSHNWIKRIEGLYRWVN